MLPAVLITAAIMLTGCSNQSSLPPEPTTILTEAEQTQISEFVKIVKATDAKMVKEGYVETFDNGTITYTQVRDAKGNIAAKDSSDGTSVLLPEEQKSFIYGLQFIGEENNVKLTASGDIYTLAMNDVTYTVTVKDGLITSVQQDDGKQKSTVTIAFGVTPESQAIIDNAEPLGPPPTAPPAG